MDYKATGFPFTIMDVASLLRLNIRREGSGHIYVDCPICGDRRGKMNLNLTKNVWRCNYCGEGGGMLALYAKVYRISNSDAYKEICDALQTGSAASAYSTPSPAGSNKEMPQAERASEQEIHRTFTTMMSALSLTPAHREHLRSKRGLTDAQIDQFGFKSTPPPEFCRILARQLAEFGYRVQGVPGFYIDDYGKWTIKFHRRTSGILIPVRSVEGLLCGLQTRLDKPIRDKDDPPEKSGIKYLTLSSTGKNKEDNSLCRKIKKAMLRQFRRLYRKRGVRRFYIGGAIGVNLWAGELLLKLKEEPGYEDLELAVILPFPGHDAKWDVRSRKRLEYLIRHSVEHLTVGTEDCRESYISQNRYLVDHAQCLVAVGEEHREQETESFQVTTYAREKGLEIIYIHPDTAEVTDVPK